MITHAGAVGGKSVMLTPQAVGQPFGKIVLTVPLSPTRSKLSIASRSTAPPESPAGDSPSRMAFRTATSSDFTSYTTATSPSGSFVAPSGMSFRGFADTLSLTSRSQVSSVVMDQVNPGFVSLPPSPAAMMSASFLHATPWQAEGRRILVPRPALFVSPGPARLPATNAPEAPGTMLMKPVAAEQKEAPDTMLMEPVAAEQKEVVGSTSALIPRTWSAMRLASDSTVASFPDLSSAPHTQYNSSGSDQPCDDTCTVVAVAPSPHGQRADVSPHRPRVNVRWTGALVRASSAQGLRAGYAKNISQVLRAASARPQRPCDDVPESALACRSQSWIERGRALADESGMIAKETALLYQSQEKVQKWVESAVAGQLNHIEKMTRRKERLEHKVEAEEYVLQEVRHAERCELERKRESSVRRQRTARVRFEDYWGRRHHEIVDRREKKEATSEAHVLRCRSERDASLVESAVARREREASTLKEARRLQQERVLAVEERVAVKDAKTRALDEQIARLREGRKLLQAEAAAIWEDVMVEVTRQDQSKSWDPTPIRLKLEEITKTKGLLESVTVTDMQGAEA